MSTLVVERPRVRVGDSAVYVLAGFPVAVVAFVLLLTGTALGLGTLPIVFGVVVLALTLLTAQGFAGLERARLDLLQHRRVPRPSYKRPSGGPVGRALSAGSDPRRWLDLAHGLIGFPVAVVSFAVTVTWFAVAATGLSYVLWEWSIPRDGDTVTLADQMGLGDGRLPDVLVTTGIGAVAALTLPFVVRGCAAVQAGLAWSMLCGDTGRDAG